MTDNEIIKALECCSKRSFHHYPCNDCPLLREVCLGGASLMKPSIDLINRQKAEIERLKEECSCLGCENEWLKAHLEQAKSEAVKEFAKELKEKYSMEIDGYYGEVVFHCDIDNLVKERVGES